MEQLGRFLLGFGGISGLLWIVATYRPNERRRPDQFVEDYRRGMAEWSRVIVCVAVPLGALLLLLA